MFRTVLTPATTPRHPDRLTMLVVLEATMAALAVSCGVVLMVNGMSMSRDVLANSPFTSFTLPGLILAVVVGGSQIVAALLAWHRHHASSIASLIAGGILAGWIAVEAVMVRDGRILQLIVFLWAVAIVALAWRHEHRLKTEHHT